MEGLEQRLGNQDSANRYFAEYKLILFGATCCDDEQEHLRADDEAPAGLQDADEEAGAGRQYYLINYVNYGRQIYHMNISA